MLLPRPTLTTVRGPKCTALDSQSALAAAKRFDQLGEGTALQLQAMRFVRDDLGLSSWRRVGCHALPIEK